MLLRPNPTSANQITDTANCVDQTDKFTDIGKFTGFNTRTAVDLNFSFVFFSTLWIYYNTCCPDHQLHSPKQLSDGIRYTPMFYRGKG